MKMKVSVVLPTYNERDNIAPLIEAIMREASPYEIIVVDDDSPDGTWRVVEELGDRYPNLRLLRRIGRRGLTSALQEGISMAQGNAVVWMDCDFSMPPEAIPRLIHALRHSDIAVGSRYVPGGGDSREFSRVLTSRIFNAFATLMLDRGIRDYTSGFLAVKKKVFYKVKLRGDYGEYCIDFLYKAAESFKITEVPYVNVPRRMGETKTAPKIKDLLRHGVNYSLYVLKLRIGGL